eukprot:7408297-Pyramimonas_sp.AAC.2
MAESLAYRRCCSDEPTNGICHHGLERIWRRSRGGPEEVRRGGVVQNREALRPGGHAVRA